MKDAAWDRLISTLRLSLTAKAEEYFPLLGALRDRIDSNQLTQLDSEILSRLDPSDLSVTGTTATDVVIIVHDALSQY